jgi:hypothetical protein
VSAGPAPTGEERRRRAWRLLVGIQLLAVGLVVVAVVAVWIVGMTSDLYGSR